ncbi:alpha/beta hydrolase [Mycolicibacterium sp. 050158]|uniref:alpha/beta hydrolase n=1 Tax=Mycolicibacterium sp. 050158 TaxID=3090602 RepID=UPI0039A5D037
MTRSLPVEGRIAARTAPVPHAEVGRPGRAKLAMLNASSAVMLRLLPHVPDAVKRLLLGRRTITVDGNTLDTTLQFMLAAQRAAGVNGLVASSDVGVARDQLRTLSAMLDAGIAVGVRDTSVPGLEGPIPVRHYTPVNVVGPASGSGGRPPLLVFFHGGGFVVGDLDTHDGLCRLICRDAGIGVLAVDYRLAPEHPAPAAFDDCYAVYRWALEHAAELGADPARVAVGGDSAGGNLAAVVCQAARRDAVPLPVLQLLIYPVTDFVDDTRSRTLFSDGYFLSQKDIDWFRENYLLGSALELSDPSISPLLAEDLSGLPPAMVLTGGFDPLRDEGNRYAEALAAAGVTVDHRQFGSLVHGFANFFPLGGASATATAEMISALRAHLSRG